MKWVFIAGLLALIPALTAMLRGNPKYLNYAAFAMGLLPFLLMDHLYVAAVSWAAWPGPVKGIEVSLLDAVAVAVLLSTTKVRTPFALKASFGVVLLALFISTCAAVQVFPALFFAWQLLRCVIFFLAVGRLCAALPIAPVAMISGLGVGLIYEAILAIYQFHGGDPRPGGNLGHSNFLGLASDFVVFPALALMLGGRRFLWPASIVAAGMMIAIVGGSRATLGLFGAGSVLTIVLSLRHRRTSKKMAVAGAAALMLVAATPVLLWSLDRRTEENKASSDQERASMKLAARMMIDDHPLGVGANQYVIMANMGGYSERAGVPWNPSERAAPVHDAYYLVTAEFGFAGLFGLVGILLSLIGLGVRSLGKVSDESSELIPGLLASMLVVAIHISFEWVFMNFVLQYLLASTAAMLVVIGARSKAAKAARHAASASVLRRSRRVQVGMDRPVGSQTFGQ